LTFPHPLTLLFLSSFSPLSLPVNVYRCADSRQAAACPRLACDARNLGILVDCALLGRSTGFFSHLFILKVYCYMFLSLFLFRLRLAFPKPPQHNGLALALCAGVLCKSYDYLTDKQVDPRTSSCDKPTVLTVSSLWAIPFSITPLQPDSKVSIQSLGSSKCPKDDLYPSTLLL